MPRLVMRRICSMMTVAFKPSFTEDPRRIEFTLLEQLLAKRVRGGADLADLANERVDVDVIDRLSAHGLKANELAFIIPRRTLTHRRQQHERVD
jgi:uncharacterized protein (DUF2384 family)